MGQIRFILKKSAILKSITYLFFTYEEKTD